MTSAVVFFELFEIDTFVVLDGDEIVILFFVVADEEVFGITARIGDVDTTKFGHIINGFVLGDFVFDFFLI